jgi:hypothetical protein
MDTTQKKSQIIQGYLKEITPYLSFEESETKQLVYNCSFKIDSLNDVFLDNILYDNNNKSLIIDFSNTSIKEVYTSLNKIHAKVIAA